MFYGFILSNNSSSKAQSSFEDSYIPTFALIYTVYPKKYAHGFVVLCFVVVMQSFIMNSHEVFIHIYQGCFADTGAIVRLPQCQWSKPDGYGKISQCITTTKHSKAKNVCIFLGIYCTLKLKRLQPSATLLNNNALKCWLFRGSPPLHAPRVLRSAHLCCRLCLGNVIRLYQKMFGRIFGGKCYHKP